MKAPTITVLFFIGMLFLAGSILGSFLVKACSVLFLVFVAGVVFDCKVLDPLIKKWLKP